MPPLSTKSGKMLAHAAEKPLFGWGGYGRNHVYDMATGRMLTIADGAWIISLGIYGWVGYIAEFGLLALPLVKLGAAALHRPANRGTTDRAESVRARRTTRPPLACGG